MTAPRLTCVLADLSIGGVPRLYLDLLGHLARGGRPCRIVAPDGPWRERVLGRGIAWQPVDWRADRAVSYARVAELLTPGEHVVVVGDPLTTHVLGAAAGNGPALLAMHSAAPRLEGWFAADALDRLRTLVAALGAAGRLGVLTIGDRYVDAYAELFALDRALVSLLPPAVDCEAIPFAAAERPLDSVLVVARLSPEKEPQLRAGVALVAERLAQGARCRLDVVGDGPWRGRAMALAAEVLPPRSFAFHGAWDDPSPFFALADVVLGTGLTALEAAAAGCRVGIVRTALDDRGALGPVLRPDTYDLVAADSFGARTLDPCTPAATWAALERLTIADRRAVRARLERDHSVTAAATALEAAFPGTAAEPAALAVGAHAARLEDRLREVGALADELWRLKLQLESAVASPA